MKKFQKLTDKREKLESKIAELCQKFTQTTGVIVKLIHIEIDLNNSKDEAVYQVDITGEI